MRGVRRLGEALVAAALIAPAASGHVPATSSTHLPPCSRPHWLGSWMAAPTNASSETFSDQTLRMIIAPHFGGQLLRIHLSNRFGSAPVTLGPVTVGTETAGPSVLPGSLRRVSFGGSRTVTIAPGADALSDPVALSTSPFRDLAVSLLVPGSESSPTQHFITRQTSYLSQEGTGDHTADTSGAAFTQTTRTGNSTGWYYLDGLDVQARSDTAAVVAFGDSLTDGFQPSQAVGEEFGNLNQNTRYPDDLQRRLSFFHLPLSVLNAGVTADLLLRDVFFPAGIHLFPADVVPQAAAADVIVLEGINDLRTGASAQDVIAGYENLIAQAHRAGLRIQLGTLTPVGGTADAATVNPLRGAVNSWIRTQRLADGVIDFDAAVRDAANPDALAPPYDAGDHLHLTPGGNWALAQAVGLRALTRPRCTYWG